MWDYNIIDLNEAINRVLGHKDMYKRWLEEFFVDETLEVVDETFLNEDHEKAHRAVHKLKGTAGNLAICKLFEQARNLDEMIKLKKDFPSLKPELDTLKEYYSEAEKMYRDNLSEIETYEYICDSEE